MPLTAAFDLARQRPALSEAMQLAARHAASARQQRSLHPVVAEALSTAGFARSFVPASRGGQPQSFAALLPQVGALASACPSAAWCATILAVVGRMAAYLPAIAQQEIWHAGPDVRLSASFRSTGTVTREGDGWRLAGTWHYLSGIAHAHWALLCIDCDDGQARFAALPAGCWSVLDDWATLGMRGTGSHSIRLEGVQVPRHMTFLRQDLVAGQSSHSEGPQYQASPMGADPQLFVACALGAARRGLEYARQAPVSEGGAVALARAEAALDGAWLLLREACLRTDQGALPAPQVARNARDATYAAEQLLAAMDALLRLAGARAQFEDNPLQQAWRDIHTLATHIGLRPETVYPRYVALT